MSAVHKDTASSLRRNIQICGIQTLWLPCTVLLANRECGLLWPWEFDRWNREAVPASHM